VGAREPASLVENNLDLAHKAARLVYPRVRGHVELEELVALANAGLAEAAARFDPGQGASFRTFAWYRVHGAVVDGLRKATHLPRRTWNRLVALRAAGEYLENQGEREAGAQHRGAAAPSTADALRGIKDSLSAIRTMYMTSLAAMVEAGLEPANEDDPVEDRIDRARLAARLVAALDTLPERERALVKMHYWEGKNLLEAGVELGISKSWACRLHAQAVQKIRAAMTPEPGEPVPDD
jgi:RNA polymerase sigma factor FliA